MNATAILGCGSKIYVRVKISLGIIPSWNVAQRSTVVVEIVKSPSIVGLNSVGSLPPASQ